MVTISQVKDYPTRWSTNSATLSVCMITYGIIQGLHQISFVCVSFDISESWIPQGCLLQASPILLFPNPLKASLDHIAEILLIILRSYEELQAVMVLILIIVVCDVFLLGELLKQHSTILLDLQQK